MTAHDLPLLASVDEDGALSRLVLNRPRGNVLDSGMIAAMIDEIESLHDRPEIRAVSFEGQGEHFSYGASVEEHREDSIGAFLPRFHALFRALAASRRVLIAVIRGRCLGGGLELAAFCHRVFAAPGAILGNPEIRLGVIAPVASVVLPRRVGARVAEELLLTGRDVSAEEALALGRVDVVADDPPDAARAWFREHLQDKSGAALRFMVAAARDRLHRDLDERLDRIERIYLDELMDTRDAREGIAAFLEKRKPRWTHR